MVEALFVSDSGNGARIEAPGIVGLAQNHIAADKARHNVEFARSLPGRATGTIHWRPLQKRENRKTEKAQT